MNRKSLLFRSGGFLAVLVLGLGAGGLRADPVKAVVESVHGTVEFAPPGSSSFAPLEQGKELAVGSTIRTGDDGSAVILTTPGSAIKLGSDSNLRLNALAFAKSGSTVTQREAHLQLTSGVVSALIDPSTPKITDFQVQTPEGSAAARGTFYAVMVYQGKTYVSVKHGRVGASSKQD
ncbi:MAG TPA: FecR family protein [Candidatus Methylacidiphilales bacterium]|jgi:hypothetical protein|nr:FecR family protein [Candidatus Methylacidiphilales bacterium]